ncbi:uncharacterized protein TNCV_2253171 [Trichonephila clavipes]|nr:uncharacterized protein TNCV_2253171 [Trichonephila clavipes]
MLSHAWCLKLRLTARINYPFAMMNFVSLDLAFADQNSNESLHSVIWSKCSTETSAKSRRVNIAVSEALSEYNFGTLKSLKEVQNAANLDIGEEAVKIAATCDYRRKKERNRQSNLAFRISRRKVKLANLRKEKYSKKKERITYSPGFL